MLTRVADFAENQIMRYMFGQSAMFDFADAIDNGKILLVNIPGEYEDLSRLVGGIIVGQLLAVMLQRKNTPRSERGFFNLYIDEFQNYVSDSINKMAEECRKYGLALTVSHQSTKQRGITDEIKVATRQIGSKIFFKLSNIDASEVASVFDITPPLAVKPPPVIPANVLDELYRHPHEAVRLFWRKYVQRWKEAAKKQEKERIRTTTEWHVLGPEQYEETITTYPEYDFGEGVVLFAQRCIEEILLLLNDLLIETQENGIVPIQKKIALIRQIAALLRFPTFYRHSYSATAYYSFEQTLRGIRQTREEDIARQEAAIAEKEKPLSSDDAFLSLHLQGSWKIRARKHAGVWKESYTEREQVIYRISEIFQRNNIVLGEVVVSTKEALWISMQRAAAENKRLESFAKYEQWIAARKDMLQKMLGQLQKERTQETIRLAPYARVQEEYQRIVQVRPVPFSWFIKRFIYAVVLCVVAVWCFNETRMPFTGNVPLSTANTIIAIVLAIVGVLAGIWACYLFISTIHITIDEKHPKRPPVPGNPYGDRYGHLSFLVQNTSWKREVTLCHAPLFTMPIIWPPHGMFTGRFFGELTEAGLASLDFSSCESIVKLDEKIAEIQQRLKSDEKALAYPYSTDHPVAHRKSDIRAYADVCLLYSSYDTAERILALNKDLYRAEVIKPLQDKVAEAKKKLSSDLEALRATLMAEKAPHDRFVNALDTVLSVLLTPKGKIAVASTEWVDTPISQQTYADREKEISNILTHLPARHAMVSIASGEFTMKTHDIPAAANFAKKKERILENTIRRYCKSRAEVEREIAERIRPDDNPPPTQRKHTLS